jgi:hypothetical protein
MIHELISPGSSTRQAAGDEFVTRPKAVFYNFDYDVASLPTMYLM